jgi:hypothetical protein
MLTTRPLLVPRLRNSCTIPPLTIWVLLGLLQPSPPPIFTLKLYHCTCLWVKHIRIWTLCAQEIGKHLPEGPTSGQYQEAIGLQDVNHLLTHLTSSTLGTACILRWAEVLTKKQNPRFLYHADRTSNLFKALFALSEDKNNLCGMWHHCCKNVCHNTNQNVQITCIHKDENKIQDTKYLENVWLPSNTNVSKKCTVGCTACVLSESEATRTRPNRNYFYELTRRWRTLICVIWLFKGNTSSTRANETKVRLERTGGSGLAESIRIFWKSSRHCGKPRNTLNGYPEMRTRFETDISWTQPWSRDNHANDEKNQLSVDLFRI